MNAHGSGRQAPAARPWWLELAINLAPLAILIAYNEWDTIKPWLESLRERVIPAGAAVAEAVEADAGRLRFLRARYEAGGWAGAADRAEETDGIERAAEERETNGGNSAGADSAD